MASYIYYQIKGGEEHWKVSPIALKSRIVAESAPMFVTVLAVSKIVEDLSSEEKFKLTYEGPLYFDWDAKNKTDPTIVIEKVNQFLGKLVEMKVDLEMCRLYATGGRGYHLEIPQGVFMDKVPRAGVQHLPATYREMAFRMVVDTLDMQVYSGGKGRMWRQPNVQRDNGRYKVQITAAEMRDMTPDECVRLTSEPRPLLAPRTAEMCLDLALLYSEASQKVEEAMKKRKNFKPDPAAKEKANGISIEWLMAGIGIKPTVGFQYLATQLGVVAHAAGWSEAELVEKCAGLIASHQSDGDRYSTEGKRAEELRRMWRYMEGNACYPFEIGPLKYAMTHTAPDLDNIPTTKEEVKELIDEAAVEDTSVDVDEYSDVARGISLSRYGVYMETADGKKRICAISFRSSAILKSIESCQIVGYETEVLVNGRPVGRQTLEMDVFSSLVQFNRFAARYGHSFQGTDAQVRTVMMRFVEQAKKKGEEKYIVSREGLDLVRIPHHEDPRYREPFLIWADGHTVITQPDVDMSGLHLAFAGYPDPRGVFKTDISHAPQLKEWLTGEGNKKQLRDCLANLFGCQKAELLGKFLGWYTACFWKPLFQAAYEKFPLLHVVGTAGAGKTDMTVSIANLFSYKQGPKVTSPGSTVFSLTQYASGSASMPLLIDEYKAHTMPSEIREKLRGMFRDAYNQRDVSRGGGSRESDNYRMLHTTQLSAPVVFIAEATEDETAVMERVVLATVVRPPYTVASQWLQRWQAFRRDKHLLGILGQYLAVSIVHEYTLDGFRDEFDALYAEAQERFMVTQKDIDGGISEDELRIKQNAKERTVYNHTVALYGFQKFRELVNNAVGSDLDDKMSEMEAGIYSRMSDLQATTTPEVVRVLKDMASMSWSVEKDLPYAVRKGAEYALYDENGQDLLEIDARTMYFRYGMYMRSVGATKLMPGVEAFSHALQDSPAFVGRDGKGLHRPGVMVLRVAELTRLGVPTFQP